MIHVFIFITVRHSARDDAAMIITYYCTVRVRVVRDVGRERVTWQSSVSGRPGEASLHVARTHARDNARDSMRIFFNHRRACKNATDQLSWIWEFIRDATQLLARWRRGSAAPSAPRAARPRRTRRRLPPARARGAPTRGVAPARSSCPRTNATDRPTATATDLPSPPSSAARDARAARARRSA